MAVESRVGFPFQPLVGHCLKWDPVARNSKLSTPKKRFLSVVSATLGNDPQSQTKVYSTADLLNRDSLSWCGIGSGLEALKIELGFEEDPEYPSWTLHPGRVFSSDYSVCWVHDSEGCQTAHGR